MMKYTVLPLVVSLLLPWTSLCAEVETEANVPVELTFTAQRQHADPFHDVTLDLVFVDPKGVTRKVPAFWAGNNLWKARYAAAEIGTHRWQSECSDGQDNGLQGQQGEVEITPYRGDNPLFQHGPIRVAADRRHLEHADGTPFFWLGDTWWMGLCLRLRWPDEFQQLAANRKELGFNVVQLVAGLYPDQPAFDPRGANEAGFPWEHDYARIRPEYFDAADRRLRHLVDEGIVPCIVGAWGYYMPWMGEVRLKLHWRYLIARYGAWPVVWCAAGEANLPWYLAEGFPYDDQATARRWCDVMRYIRAVDPWQRLLTVHPTAVNAYTARHVVDEASLLDFDFLQTPHDGPGLSVERITGRTVVESRAAEPVMPVINGEASYENLLDRIPAAKPRAMFWLCMMNGAAGHTYGANGIWQMNRKGQPHGPSPTATSPPTGYGTIAWDEAMHLPAGRQIAAGKQWLSQLPWWTFAPHYTWAGWAEPAPAVAGDAPIAARGGPGEEVAPCGIGTDQGPRVFYMFHSRAVALRQLEPGRVYRLTHFDPVEGTTSDGGIQTPGQRGDITVAAPDHGHDWVLLLQPVDK